MEDVQGDGSDEEEMQRIIKESKVYSDDDEEMEEGDQEGEDMDDDEDSEN
jgi:hypothetical protein